MCTCSSNLVSRSGSGMGVGGGGGGGGDSIVNVYL